MWLFCKFRSWRACQSMNEIRLYKILNRNRHSGRGLPESRYLGWLIIKESLARQLFRNRFSHRRARYFLLLRQATWMWWMWKKQERFSTKESIQRKGDPDAACFLRFSHWSGVAPYWDKSKGTSCPFDNTWYPYRVPNGLFLINAPMLGVAYGGL